MTISINMRGHTRAESSVKLQKHIERDELSEEEQKRIRENTDSQIFGDRTHTNVELFRATHADNEGLYGFPEERKHEKVKDIMKIARNIDDAVNADRKANGHRKQDKRANISMSGTLQLGDDSLKLIGYDKKKPRWEQEEKAEIVEMIYKDIVHSVQSQKDVYGYMQLAKLHLDEGSPHVDMAFLAKPVRDEKGVLKSGVREILNGKEGTPRGQKMKTMQDLLTAEVEELTPILLKKYNIVRGEPNSKKLDAVRNYRQTQQDQKELDKSVVDTTHLLENLEKDKEKLEEELKEKEEAITTLEDTKQEMEDVIKTYRADLVEIINESSEISQSLNDEAVSFPNKVIQLFAKTYNELIRDLKRAPDGEEIKNALGQKSISELPHIESLKDVNALNLSAKKSLKDLDAKQMFELAQKKQEQEIKKELGKSNNVEKDGFGPNFELS